MKDPAVRARQLAGIQRLNADEAYRARRDAAASINGKKAILAVDRKKGGATRSRLALSWCPPEHVPLYVKLRQDLGAKNARRIVGELVEKEARATVRRIAAEQAQRQARQRAQAY